MKNKKAVIIFSVIIGVLIACTAIFTDSSATKDDPLVTLGYLEEIILPSFKEDIINEIKLIYTPKEADENDMEAVEVSAKPEEDSETTEAETQAEAISPVSNTYTLLELDMGQTVMADSICEFIVRPGSKVEAISSFPEQGIADITNGIEVLNGDIISLNAYCLIPRGKDGRGMKVLSEKAYIMIRGEYTVG